MKRAARTIVGTLLTTIAWIGIAGCSGASADRDAGARDDPDGGVTNRDAGDPDSAQNDDAAQNNDAALDASTSDGATSVSCLGLPSTCGGDENCCASNVVVGGMFDRSNDNAYPATVSTFKLDVYEVTVGRFRAFVNAGKGTQASPPAPGDGAHPTIASSGWDVAFDVKLAPTSAELRANLACDAAYPAWTDVPNGNETRPMNCVTWFDAFAFCAWDGGRLPTEAEWNYAAAGGAEQREYAWGADIDPTMASYDCTGDGSAAGACAFDDMLPVGSKSPQGDGKWGQADLSGNVWEYTLDYSAVPYRLTACTDCADLQLAQYRTFRGGGFANESFYEGTSVRLERSPEIADYDVGFRCAR